MSDDPTTQQGQQATGVFIPPALRESHGELIDLILKSESMNDEERQYWVDIIPAMTTDQIEQLHTILINERDQLAAIDAKYDEGMKPQDQGQSQPPRPLETIAKERTERAQERFSKEHELEAAEAQAEEDILKQVDEL